jgi:ABC-type transport system substrate-binding protein/ABC-type branched-subunit amino acid transport system substrate-binding protein
MRLLTAMALVALVGTALVVPEASSAAAEPDSTAVTVDEGRLSAPAASKANPKAKKCTDPLGCINYKKKDEVVLGAALGLSGPLADLGQGQLRAVGLAAAEHGDLFGHPIVVHAEDSACTPDGGAAAASALTADPLVAAIVGTSCSSAALPAAPIVTAAGSVMVSPSNTLGVLTAPGTHEAGYLRVAWNDVVQAMDAAELAADLGFGTSVVVNGGVYDPGIADAFAATFAARGGTNLATLELDPGAPDVATMVGDLVAAGPSDVALSLVFEPHTSELLTAIRAEPALDGMAVLTFRNIGVDGLLANIGDVADGLLVVSVVEPAGPVYDAFAASYEAEFGEAPATMWDAYAYDAANLILDAIDEVGIAKNKKLQIGRQALRDALYATSGYEGASGTITCDEYGDCATPTMARFVVRDGELLPIIDGFVPLSEAAESCDYGGLLKRITAVDRLNVEIELCRPDVALPSKVAFPAFGIHSQGYLETTGGTGDLITSPVGTGPYEFAEWGDTIELEPYAGYWGGPASAAVSLQWEDDAAVRLGDLVSGTVDGIDRPDPADYGAIETDPDLELLFREPLDIFYIGMNRDAAPFDDERVRQAMAMAVDRQRIVDLFWPEGSLVADQFLPPGMFGYTEDPGWYDHDPVAAKALLVEAGYPSGFAVTLTYRDVERHYLPTPEQVADEIANQLSSIGVVVTVELMDSPAFLEAIEAGELPLHLLGWTVDWPDATNMLDYHFGPEATNQFGAGFADIWDVLVAARSTDDSALRLDLYQQATELLKQHAPMIPVAHSVDAVAFRADVAGAHADPLGTERFAPMDPGGRDVLAFVGDAEPDGLYCGDASYGPSFRACVQINQGLLAYEVGGTAVEPLLATTWWPNDDLTLWTFDLRDGVSFHDGSEFDANDFVMTYVMMWDATHPLHIGNTGQFTYFEYIFGILTDG